MSTNDVWHWPRIARTRKDLRNAQNKSEGEPTSGRSTNYGSAHLIPIFRGIGRTFSQLLPKQLDAAFQAWPHDVILGTPLTAEEEDRILLAHSQGSQTRQRLGRSFQMLQMQLTENGILTSLASGLADEKVEHARDGAIKFVAGQAATIALN